MLRQGRADEHGKAHVARTFERRVDDRVEIPSGFVDEEMMRTTAARSMISRSCVKRPTMGDLNICHPSLGLPLPPRPHVVAHLDLGGRAYRNAGHEYVAQDGDEYAVRRERPCAHTGDHGQDEDLGKIIRSLPGYGGGNSDFDFNGCCPVVHHDQPQFFRIERALTGAAESSCDMIPCINMRARRRGRAMRIARRRATCWN